MVLPYTTCTSKALSAPLRFLKVFTPLTGLEWRLYFITGASSTLAMCTVYTYTNFGLHVDVRIGVHADPYRHWWMMTFKSRKPKRTLTDMLWFAFTYIQKVETAPPKSCLWPKIYCTRSDKIFHRELKWEKLREESSRNCLLCNCLEWLCLSTHVHTQMHTSQACYVADCIEYIILKISLLYCIIKLTL